MTEERKIIHCPCGLLLGARVVSKKTLCPGCTRLVSEIPTSWSDKPRMKKTQAIWNQDGAVEWLSTHMNPEHLEMLANVAPEYPKPYTVSEIRDGDVVIAIEKEAKYADCSPQMRDYFENHCKEPQEDTRVLRNIGLESSLVNQAIAKLPKNGHEWARISVKRRANTYGDDMVIVGAAECRTCKSNVSYNFSSNSFYSSKDNNKWINNPRFPLLENKCPIKYSCNECKDKHIGIYSIAPKRGI